MAEGLATIQDSGWHLLRMIDDILDHARGLAGKLAIVPGPVDWPAFLRGVEQNAQVLAARNGNAFSLRLSGAPLRRVQLDEGRLRQVIDNLLANAARHTRHGRISLECIIGAETTDGTLPLDFAVTDSGEGISVADQERIFLPFERGSRAVSRHGGKGIGMGLAIARQLVGMMGGRLTVDSRPGEGACFRFQAFALADHAAADERVPIERDSRYEGPRRTVLLVDDEGDNRRILAAFLRDTGFAVIEAGSGRAAIEMSPAAGRIDLVLADQFMADGDGWMVLRSMADRHPRVPVVSISAAPPDRPAVVPAEIVFAAHLMKPLDHRKVLCCIGDLLGLDFGPDPMPSCEPAVVLAPPGPRPDPAAMDALRQMIDNGQVSGIMSWADALKVAEPRCNAFADDVRAAARRLDFPALNALAER